MPTSDSLFCAFDSGLTVDYSILPYRQTWWWLQLARNPVLGKRLLARQIGEAAYLFQQGVHILYDPYGFVGYLETHLKRQPAWVSPMPSRTEWDSLHREFWLGVVKTARYLRNGNALAAHQLYQRFVQRELLRLAVWEAQARHQEWDHPLKYRDKYIEAWADPEMVAGLPTLLSGYDISSQWEALHLSGQLFIRLAGMCGASLGHPTHDNDHAILIWVAQNAQAWQAEQHHSE